MDKKKKRLIIRTTILAVFIVSVGYAMYFNLNDDQAASLEGDQAPNFKLEEINGSTVELSKYSGKVTLINFWGTWCEPCKREMPAIQATYDKYKNDGFEVVSVNLQESSFAVSKFTERYNLTFPVLLDKKGEVTQLYNVYKIPASFLVDRNGKIVRTYEGEVSEELLNKWVTNLL